MAGLSRTEVEDWNGLSFVHAFQDLDNIYARVRSAQRCNYFTSEPGYRIVYTQDGPSKTERAGKGKIQDGEALGFSWSAY